MAGEAGQRLGERSRSILTVLATALDAGLG